MFIYTDYNNTYSGYNSENSNYWEYSSYSTDSSCSYDSSNYTITSEPSNYYRKDNLRKTQNHLKMHRHKMRYIRDIGEENNSNNHSIDNNIGYDSGFNKDTPFINYLINKRISFCELGDSSHIAAFVPSTCSSRCCFIREWKGKDNYGWEFFSTYSLFIEK